MRVFAYVPGSLIIWIPRSSLSANENDDWVFYAAPKLCALGDEPGLQQPCNSPDCLLCTILRESFNAESCGTLQCHIHSGTSYLTIADFMVEYEGNYLMWETLSPGLLQSEHLSQVRQQVVRFHSFIW